MEECNISNIHALIRCSLPSPLVNTGCFQKGYHLHTWVVIAVGATLHGFELHHTEAVGRGGGSARGVVVPM